jgi:uncharacterized protein YcgI (DUF1989 family)
MRRTALTCGALILSSFGAASTQVLAEEAGLGPRGLLTTACASDIDKLCADKVHDGGVRACLEARKAEVTKLCRTALDSRGGPGPR